MRPMAGPTGDLRVLVDYREQLVAERTALASRVHVDLCCVPPGHQHALPRHTQPAHLRAATALLDGDQSVRAAVTRRRVQRMIEINADLRRLREQIGDLVTASGTSLTSIYGIGPLIAARILAEVVDIARYPSRHHFAAADGSAPIPASSGRTVRHRLNRGRNRQLNRALYTIAITEIRGDTEGRSYYQRKRAEGKTGRDAVRCLKRRLADVIYKTMRADAPAAIPASPPAAAA